MKSAQFIRTLLLLFCVKVSFCQIPNSSFENWTGSQPDGWTACRTPPNSPYYFETQVNTACQGNRALKSEAILLTYTPTILVKVSAVYSGNSSTNFYLPLGPKPSYLKGCYIFQNYSDYLSFKVNIKSGGNIIGTGSFTTATTATAYTQFIANINYSSVALPDSFSIQLAINNSAPCTGPWSTQASQQTTYFIVDNLSFDVNAGMIENHLANEIVISPNPVSNMMFIQSKSENIQIDYAEIYDSRFHILGRFRSENNRLEVDLEDYCKGLYFIRVQIAGEESAWKKIVKE